MKQTEPQIEPELLEKLILDDQAEDQRSREAARQKAVASLRLLWQERGFLRRVAAYALLASLAIAFLIPVRHQSTARLMPPDDHSSNIAMLAALTRAPGGFGGLAGDFLGLKNRGALFVGVLQSRTVQDRLIERFDLPSGWTGRIEDARTALADQTFIAEDRKSGIIEITVAHHDPIRARDIAQAYVNELNRVIAEVSTSAARRERIFIEERLKVVKQDLDVAAREFSQFASKNNAIDIKEQGRAMFEAAATLQGQLIAAQTELESLKQLYTESNVRIRAGRARVAELKKQLQKMGGPDLADLQPGARSTDSPYPTMRRLPLLGVTYADLYRRIKVAEVVFELLTQQYELAKVQEAKEIPSVKVLDQPVVAQRSSYPPRTLIVALGTGAAFVLGCVLVLAGDRWQRTSDDDGVKQLLREIGGAAQATWKRFSRNGLHQATANGGGNPLDLGEPREERAPGPPTKGNGQP